jgi:hypothetical protein
MELPLAEPDDDHFFQVAHEPANIAGRFFKFRLDFQGPAEVYGFQIASSVVREWPAL